MKRLTARALGASLLLLALPACAGTGTGTTPAAMAPAGVVAPAAPAAKAITAPVTARGSLRIAESGRRLAAVPVPNLFPFTRSRLVRVELYLTPLGDDAGPAELSHLILPAGFDATVSFTMKPDVPYRIAVKAFQPEDATDADSLVEAQSDEASGVDVSGPAGAFIDLDLRGGIPVTLKDRTFQGKTSAGFGVVDGNLTSTGSGEALGDLP